MFAVSIRRVGFCGLIAVALVGSLALAAPPEPDDPFDPRNMAQVAPVQPPNPAAAPRTVSGQRRIDFDVAVTPAKARRGSTVQVKLQAKFHPRFHTYPATQRTAAQPEEMLSSVKFELAPGIEPVPGLTETPPPEFVREGKDYYLEYKQLFTWTQELAVLPNARPGLQHGKVLIHVQVCDQTCKWEDYELPFSIEVEDGEPLALPEAIQQRLAGGQPPIRIVAVPGELAGTGVASKPTSDSTLWAFMLTGIFWGAVSLVTPCVFPMIPITVSFFLKQSEKEHHRPITMALVYCSTIVVVLTISAVALLSLFREFSTSPLMNFALGGLFLFFALSLFGMYEIELPSGLARFTSAREGKGGLVGTMFMALTFTIISFACVAPFLGGFGGTAATSGMTWTHRILGGLAFSVTFASPFFVLALFPTLLKKLPKSGNWLNAVKVVMGFLELAAAVKFFRAGELVYLPKPELFTYDFSLGLYVAVSVLCGLYLLNLFRLPHDTPAEHLPVPQLVVSLLFLGLGLYLSPALFKQRPAGVVFAWINSFLLPDAVSDLPWNGDLRKSLEEARGQGKLVFVDFTGATCTNCKFNEENVFSKPEIRGQLQKFKLVQLYTDKVPDEFYPPQERAKFGSSTAQQRADAAKNLQFQRKRFDTEQLPLYVILKPLIGGEFEVLARYDEGKINDESAFLSFLDKPLSDTVVTTARITP